MASLGNQLHKSQSPYLKQHAKNPVHWVPWADNYLNLAKENDQLIIISIGYAACHWCHVMEQESFEDHSVALLMNTHFINIKVDREERPDIDHIYMQALQLLTGQGGWPLNIVALPDGRPVWGGTYFTSDQWVHYLKQLIKLQKENPEKLIQYANQLAQGMQGIELEKEHDDQNYSPLALKQAISLLHQKIDTTYGGMKGAPKFMMPTLLQLGRSYKSLNKPTHHTLQKMALGGLFDVLGGGFSRYSVDEKWHIPHFEKMGYDNGQLLKVYCEAYREQPNQLYKEVIEKILHFFKHDLQAQNGGYYASLDADSIDKNMELKEGAYYVWSKKELKELKLTDDPLFIDYFGINQNGYWENDHYVFYRTHSLESFLSKHHLPSEFSVTIKVWENILLQQRSKRSKPRIDDKVICSWNALIGSGLLSNFRLFGEKEGESNTKRHLLFMQQTFHRKNGGLFRLNKKGAPPVNAFLEDYSLMIAYYLDGYETFFEEGLLNQVESLIDYCFKHFLEDQSPLFFFSEEKNLILKTKEINDNVIPSSNSIMAENLFRASQHLGKRQWYLHAQNMLSKVIPNGINHPRSYSNWLRIALEYAKPQQEIVVVGNNALQWIKELQQNTTKRLCWAASEKSSKLPLLKHRFQENQTWVYLCKNNVCKLPINNLAEARKALDTI